MDVDTDVMGLEMFAVMLATAQLVMYGMVIWVAIRNKNNVEPIEEEEDEV